MSGPCCRVDDMLRSRAAILKRQQATAPYMEIVFLGTGGGWPSKYRNVPSTAVRLGREVLLFDCGEGTQRQLMFTSVSFMKIDRVFISHFHGDHFLGLAGLIQSMSLNKRSAALEVYGPHEVHYFVDKVLSMGYYNRDFDVNIHQLGPGEKLDMGDYWLETAEAFHHIPALAYAVEEKPRPGRFYPKKAGALGIPENKFGLLQKGQTIELEDGSTVTPDMVMGPPRAGRRIVYTGDSSPTRGIAELAMDADVLICDSTFAPEHEEKGNDYGHFSSRQAAILAKEAGVGKLVLTHISTRYHEDAGQVLAPAKEIFENTVLAEDFMSIVVKVR